MIDLEISLVQAFGWSLRDIDETAIESLIPFMARFGAKNPSQVKPKKDTQRLAYADEVDWL